MQATEALDLPATGLRQPASLRQLSPLPQPAGRPAVRVAATVDIGSNSAHLLVARVEGRRLKTLADEAVFLGLGPAVDRDGRIGKQLRTRLTDTIGRFQQTARSLGADRIALVGTEPT